MPAEFTELAIRSSQVASAYDADMPACSPSHVLINKYSNAAGLLWHRPWPRLEHRKPRALLLTLANTRVSTRALTRAVLPVSRPSSAFHMPGRARCMWVVI